MPEIVWPQPGWHYIGPHECVRDSGGNVPGPLYVIWGSTAASLLAAVRADYDLSPSNK